MTRIWQDVKYAGRLLQRAPLFSLVVIFTLAVTIGATTAVFTVVNGVLLRALPYRYPSRLVLLQEAITDDGYDQAVDLLGDSYDVVHQSIGLVGDGRNHGASVASRCTCIRRRRWPARMAARWRSWRPAPPVIPRCWIA